MPEPDGPTFLTTPPVALPDPEDRGRIVLPPTQSPYRTPGQLSQPSPPVSRPAVPERDPALDDRPTTDLERGVAVGDAAGEHLAMTRGRYSAWTYVVIAFACECLLFGAIPMRVLQPVLHEVGLLIGFLAGVVPAYFVFRDRFRCIEARASLFCSGLMNLSILYVPVVAFIYANVRGVAKLRGA
jgi:hypothetical protein